MSFGLKNVEATFQRLINIMFKSLLRNTMEIYIDDLINKSLRKEDHLDNLQYVFDILRIFGLKLNPRKVFVGCVLKRFLGHIVHKNRISVNPEQLKAILDMSAPKNIKEIQILSGKIAGTSPLHL